MRLFIIFIILSVCTGCSPEQTATNFIEGKLTQVPSAEHPQEIVVVTHAGPNTYYINTDNEFAGIEYDLAKLFTSKYAPEYKIKFLVVSKVGEVLPKLLTGKAEIAAANLSITPARKSLVKFSTAYHETQQQLVYNKRLNDNPKTLAKIHDKDFIVPAGSNHSEHLHAVKMKYPELDWHSDTNTNTELLLSNVAKGKLDYTIADDKLVNLMQNYYPNLQEAMPIGMPEKIGWAFAPHADKRLQIKVNQFFATIKKTGELRNLIDRYEGYTNRLKSNDINYFLKRVDTVLPKYKRLFKQAEKETGLNWRLLAALSFRESHWDPLNTSPTNVRGIMMLTEKTAADLGVTNRLDPVQTIPAGARYIRQLKNKFPEHIPDPDRTYLALASYNIGYAHVLDARKLARRLNLNPDSWSDIKKTLLMLNQRKYYSTVKYGRASGGAPIIFVETIRSYHRILEKYQPSKTQMLSDFFVAAR